MDDTGEASSSSSSSSASEASSSSRDLSMPYCDAGDVMPIKTNIQFYWDCPEPTDEADDSEDTMHRKQSQQRSFPVSLLPLPRRLTAKILPKASPHFADDQERGEYEPLAS